MNTKDAIEHLKSLNYNIEAPKEKPEQRKPLENIDFTRLINICKEYMEFYESEEYHEDNDFTHYITSTAMECVFGNDVYDHINSL